MTRQDLEEAIAHLEYLIVNHFHPDRIQEYSLQLQFIRNELQRLDDKYSAVSAGRV